jgi:hypothetical protein
MTLPLRKDLDQDLDEDQDITAELTTADLAQRKPAIAATPIETDPRVRPFLAEPVERKPDENSAIERISPERVASETRFSSETSAPSVPIAVTNDDTTLNPGNELEDLRHRWSDVQTGFVDEPRKAVEQADSLVASAMKRLAEVFAEERSNLEKQWDQGDSVSTEDLRVALQRYRAFFHRLLSI